MLDWCSSVLPNYDSGINRMSEPVDSFALESHGLFQAATLNHPPFQEEHVVEVKSFVPCLDVSESNVSVVDIWLFSFHFLFVILILKFGDLSVDTPDLFLVDWSI